MVVFQFWHNLGPRIGLTLTQHWFLVQSGPLLDPGIGLMLTQHWFLVQSGPLLGPRILV